jgi:DNA-directed RNA polymerase subunit beta'
MEFKNIFDFKGLKISLASPEEIKSWSKGEVTKPETINYRTLRPEKDGLFCERIFGPTKDWECYCGKYKRIRYRGVICDKCGVEVTQSRVRRERMGHITLAAPCAHIWFFKGAPSKLSLLLDIPPRALEQVIYFAQYLVKDIDYKGKKEAILKLEKGLEEKIKAIKKAAEEKIKKIEKEAEAQKKEIKKKIKNKEALSLALEEMEFKTKQNIQNVRDEQILEEEKAKEIYQNLIEKIKILRYLSLLTEDEYQKLSQYGASSFIKVGMGAEVLLEVIQKIDLNKLSSELREEMSKTTGQRYLKAAKRLRLIEGFKKAGIDPSWMIIRILPVIPPDLRPMVQLTGGRFATSDLNDLYRRVINRNNRLKHLIDLGAPEIILRNEKRMLQEAVDSLIDSSARKPKGRRNVQPLRSLSDMLRGKQGRFRQNLLGKRVDYSGRSVIVVGPELKLNQCGLPKEMALEMFKPYVLREMILRGLAPNVRSAKNILEHRPPEVFDILEEITRDHPVLLNRAPTLHKLGIQAFYPILIEGNAIRIHPCVCAGYNADFDGDQMAVHVPLSSQAKEEAKLLMMPDKNLLKPADGSPIVVPNREMALGIFYLTYALPSENQELKIFANSDEAVLAYQTGKIFLQEKIKVLMGKEIVETTVGRIIFNEVLPEGLRFINETIRASMIKSLITRAFQLYPNEEVIKLIDNLKDLGFAISTISGVSVSVFDCVLNPRKPEIVAEANKRVAEIEENFKQGLITSEEKKRLVRDVWMEVTEVLADSTWELLPQDSSIRVIVDSGSTRASRDQIKQLSAMRGLVVDPLGRIVDLPTKSNFREGLSVFEYITSARGSRKGLTDTAIKTSDAGYLTRRLVDVVHDVIVREEDCGTEEGIVIEKTGEREKTFSFRILGRILAEDVKDPKSKKIILKRGEELNEENVKLLENFNVERVVIRSPLTCKTKYGVCSKCYGWDFSNKKMVEVGTPVGVIAAQSIGEPGTQLTLKTKHSAGVVGLDVTQGLPRVEELLEMRQPKIISPLAEIGGKVSVVETEEGWKVKIKSIGKKPPEEREYVVPFTSTLRVSEGQLVSPGTQLASGALDVREILRVRGLREAQNYLISETQKVYESQGISIHDKHFEVVVRKMSEKIRVGLPGDTTLLPGELVDKIRFEEENEQIKNKGGQPATGQIVILGLTRTAINTESWLSAASFQETTNVLADVAVQGREDKLLGLKENVIIGRLIPVTPERAKLE